jgi:hypothetical protein
MRNFLLTGIAFAAAVVFVAPPPPAEAGAPACEAMAIASCKVKLKYRPTPAGVDKFVVKCDGITLGAASNGMDPVVEGLTFSLSNVGGPCFSDPLAPGAVFRRGLHGNWYYINRVQGGSPGLRLLRLGGTRTPGALRLRATANAADLQCLIGPPVIGLTVGDDCGSITCTERRPGLFDCP